MIRVVETTSVDKVRASAEDEWNMHRAQNGQNIVELPAYILVDN